MNVKKIKWTHNDLISTLLLMGDFFFCPDCNDVVRKGWCCPNCGKGDF